MCSVRKPLYAESILKARCSGKKPADPVIVSLGFLNLHRRFNWPVIVCPTEGKYDLSFLVGLDVVVGFEWENSLWAASMIRAIWLEFDAHSCAWFVPDCVAMQHSYWTVENQLIAMRHFHRQSQEIRRSLQS